MSTLTKDLMRQLSEAAGGPGNEGEVRDLIARAIRSHVQEISVDRMGNLLALKRGYTRSSRRVVVSAHMDEVVLFVNEITNDGFLRVVSSGAVNARTLLGQSVLVGPERLPGVIAVLPVHFSNPAEFSKTVPITDLVVDIGAADEKAAKLKVALGHRITFMTSCQLMAQTPGEEDDSLPVAGRIRGKAFDDRLGCAALIELLEGEAFEYDLLAIFTVQEEIGTRGALVAAQELSSDVEALFILEGTVCDDVPGAPGTEREPVTRLGAGPALTQRDGGYVVHPRLLQHIMQVATRHDIPYQFKIPNIGGTDAAGFTHASDIPAAILSLPCRYIHGPVAVAELSDFHHLVTLLRHSLMTLPLLSRWV